MQDGVVKFFTRNSNNYTRIYGPKISQHIKDNVDAQACILDGEMVVWDNEKKQVAPFGLNQKVATRDSNDDQDGNSHLQICYMIFDILYIKAHGDDSEEINLMGARLQDRKIVLSRVVKEVPNVLEIVRGKECLSVEEVFEEFN